MGYNYSSSYGVAIYIAIVVIIGVVYLFSSAFFTGWLAGKKGYSGFSWGCLDFFFGFVTLLAIGFAPDNFEKIYFKNNTLDVDKLKIVFENINTDIVNIKSFESFILSNKNKLDGIYEILKISGKEEMIKYIQYLLDNKGSKINVNV